MLMILTFSTSISIQSYTIEPKKVWNLQLIFTIQLFGTLATYLIMSDYNCSKSDNNHGGYQVKHKKVKTSPITRFYKRCHLNFDNQNKHCLLSKNWAKWFNHDRWHQIMSSFILQLLWKFLILINWTKYCYLLF